MGTRRDLLSALAAGGTLWGTASANARTPEASNERADTIEFVEADPEYGFEYPYYLERPERFREGPVPLLVEMNNADEELSFEEEKRRAKGQLKGTGTQGAWLMEELGVPHLKPVFHEPDGDPVDDTHQIALFDRETMLLDHSPLERVDLQLLRMAEHAREHVLSDVSTHDEVLMYGNSSEGVVAERMAAMHPDAVMAASGSGLNGFVLLPLDELGEYALNYPVGVADFEDVLGKSYDADAHGDVDKFFVQGGADPKNRLKVEDGFGGPLWNDQQVYDAARSVFGPYVPEERFARCQAAFAKAGVDAQFRVYPEMEHSPRPADEEILEFFERSIRGESVDHLGQQLDLPLDREPTVRGVTFEDGSWTVTVDVSGDYPPPEGLVSYSWTFGDGGTATGFPVEHTYDEPAEREVTLTMETATGQRATASIDLTLLDVDVTSSPSFPLPGETTTFELTVGNPGDAARTVDVALVDRDAGADDDGIVRAETYDLDAGETREVSVTHAFEAPGEYDVSVEGLAVGDPVTVREASGAFTLQRSYEPTLPTVGETLTLDVDVVFHDAGSGELALEPFAGETSLGRKSVGIEDYATKTATFEHAFDQVGEYDLTVRTSADDEPRPLGRIRVVAEETTTASTTADATTTATESTPTTAETTGRDGAGEAGSEQDPTTAASPSDPSGMPGLGVVSGVAGLASVATYLARSRDGDGARDGGREGR